MELEMFLNGKFIDSTPITTSQLDKIHLIQQKMERKHCHNLEYSDSQPQFFLNGIPSGMKEHERSKLSEFMRTD